MVLATRITVEELGDATAGLLASLFIARGLDPRGVADLSVLRDRLGALDDETSPGPHRRRVDPWRHFGVCSQAFRERLGTEHVQERRLASRLGQLEMIIVERLLLEERLPRWRPRRFASTEWHAERRELEARIDLELEAVIAGAGVLARWLAWRAAPS